MFPAFIAKPRLWHGSKGLRSVRTAIALLSLSALAAKSGFPLAYSGRVLDASTGAPLENAIVTLGHLEVRTNAEGMFEIDGSGNSIWFRAYGHRSESSPIADFKTANRDVRLNALRPTALYLSFFAIGSAKLGESVLRLINEKQLTGVVIDEKAWDYNIAIAVAGCKVGVRRNPV